MLAIHHREGSFSNKWIEYCKIFNVKYKLVNCYSTDIIRDLEGCYGLMWHWHHNDYMAQLFARQLFLSLEAMGLRTFPNARTCWHFDDKLGQKYLLESINAPLINSYVFYDLNTALKWIDGESFPKSI